MCACRTSGALLVWEEGQGEVEGPGQPWRACRLAETGSVLGAMPARSRTTVPITERALCRFLCGDTRPQASLRVTEICDSLQFSDPRPYMSLSGGTRVPGYCPLPPTPAPGSTESVLIRLVSSHLTSRSKHRSSLQPLKRPLLGVLRGSCRCPEIRGP